MKWLHLFSLILISIQSEFIVKRILDKGNLKGEKVVFFCCLRALCVLFFLMLGQHLNANHGLRYEGKTAFCGWQIANLTRYDPIIIEAGACCGDETLWTAATWPNGKIFAFEPNPEAYAALIDRLHSAALDNVEAYQVALGEKNGTAPFYLCTDLQSSSFLPPFNPNDEKIMQVDCVSLDDWCEIHEIDHIDILLLDVAGMEQRVLMGCPNILRKTQVIHVATYLYDFKRGSTLYSNLKAFLQNSGFILVSHWYQPSLTGRATFIHHELYQAICRSFGVSDLF